MSEQIYQLISKVMADIGHVAKNKRNEQQQYSFRGIDQFYQAAHPALVKHGVFCCPQVLEYKTEDRVMKNGSPAIHAVLKISHKFYAPDGSFVEVITCGEGLDTSDKAINKTMSAAMKYAFIELFSIPTEDIEDSDRQSPEAGAAGKGDIAPAVTLTRPTPVKVPAEDGGRHVAEKLVSGSGPSEPALRTSEASGSVGAESTSEAPAPSDVRLEDEKFINQGQQSYLARRFRESLKPELQPKAEELRHDALIALHQSKLFKSRFIDGSGNPTSSMILESEYSQVGKALINAAKSL